jgi:CCR4-NOT transcription complex subunit 6
MENLSHQETTNDGSKTDRPQFLSVNPESPQFDSSSVDKQKVISILSYNVLAEAYSYVFAQDIEQKYLDFSHRSPLAVQNIKNFSSDIICLQEIDLVHSDFYKLELEKLGYSVIFAQRPNDIPDGLIFGVKKDSFEILEHKIFQFDEAQEDPSYKKGNIAIIAKIKHKYSENIIHVISTHLFWDPRFDHVKFMQMGQLLTYANKEFTENDIVLWAGDLNSKAYSNQVLYVLNGARPEQEKLESTADNFQPLLEIYEKFEKVEKRIKWGNAYESYGLAVNDQTRSYPAFTNYTLRFKDTIDHIFFSKSNLKLQALMKVPTEQELNSKALPNHNYPSDHLPLLAFFEITK